MHDIMNPHSQHSISNNKNSTIRHPAPKNIYRDQLPRKRLFTKPSTFAAGKKPIVLIFVVIVVFFSIVIFSLSYALAFYDDTQQSQYDNNPVVSTKNTNTNFDSSGASLMLNNNVPKNHNHADLHGDRDYEVNNKEQPLVVSHSSHSEQHDESIMDIDPDDQQEPAIISNDDNKDMDIPSSQDQDQTNTSISTSTKLDKCSFRTYKPNRYYKVGKEYKPTEKFLVDAKYIRGQYPFILNPRFTNDDDQPKKLCFDTSEWEQTDANTWPFTDGQNPSVISLASNVYDLEAEEDSSSSWKKRLDDQFVDPIVQIYGDTTSESSSKSIENYYLGLLLFGDSQCRWNLSKDELEEKHFSLLESPPNKRSMLVILNETLDVIGSTVLKLEHDAKWGTKRKRFDVKKKEIPEFGQDGIISNEFERSIVELDDARLFFHNGQLNVLYRNGPYYGYDKQVQNPIHIKSTNGNTLEAYIKASETFTICCGRNIAFISELPYKHKPVDPSHNRSEKEKKDLLALTWIDPVTTEVVETATTSDGKTNRRKLVEEIPIEQILHRNLRGEDKSHIHGTNGYMLPFHTTSELFGVAHFHRPEGRETSDYARHGHHYTHAFFTIQRKDSDNESETSDTKYVLKRLSNEFVFMSPTSSDDQTADVIQFASGMDLVGSDQNGKLLISYGINDCEAASFFIGMDRVQDLLIDVEEGEEVVNLMRNVV